MNPFLLFSFPSISVSISVRTVHVHGMGWWGSPGTEEMADWRFVVLAWLVGSNVVALGIDLP